MLDIIVSKNVSINYLRSHFFNIKSRNTHVLFGSILFRFFMQPGLVYNKKVDFCRKNNCELR